MHAKAVVLNVNPGADALGSHCVDKGLSAIRCRVYKEGQLIAKEKSGAALRLAFGKMSSNMKLNQALMVSRMLFGIVMILGGFMIGSEPGSKYCAASVMAVMAGFMMIPGVMMRSMLTLTSITLFYTALGNYVNGEMAVVEFGLALISGIFAYFGPGRFSIDAILRRKIFRIVKRRETHRLMECRFSYKAMEYSYL